MPAPAHDSSWIRLRRSVLPGAAALLIASAGAVQGQLGGGVAGDLQVAQVMDEIETTSAKQARIEQESAALGQQRTALRAGLAQRVRALYRLTRVGLAPIAGGVDSVLRHVARVKRLRQLVQGQSKQLAALDLRAKSLSTESGHLQAALESGRKRLAQLQSSAQAGRLDSVFSGSGASADGFRSPGGDSFYGLRLVDSAPIATFESQRGNLSSPVSGEVRVAEGRRDESDGPGLEFQAPVGTPVRAVADGRVAFSDRYGSYGRLVILDHGDGFYTVYGGLGAVEVRVGDDLSRRARIGSIGSDFDPPALFFEVRQGTRTLPPRPWLGF